MVRIVTREERARRKRAAASSTDKSTGKSTVVVRVPLAALAQALAEAGLEDGTYQITGAVLYLPGQGPPNINPSNVSSSSNSASDTPSSAGSPAFDASGIIEELLRRRPAKDDQGQRPKRPPAPGDPGYKKRRRDK